MAPEGTLGRVLIVDDSHDAADSLVMLSRLWGYKAIACYDGASALRLAATFFPQVVVLDLGLPVMDGFEIARRLRKQSSMALLVALTGWQSEVQQRFAWDAGFDHFLIKSANSDDILALLRRGTTSAPVVEMGFLVESQELATLETAARRGGLTIGQLTRQLIRDFLARTETRRISSADS